MVDLTMPDMTNRDERLHNQPSMKDRRRALRNDATPAEKKLWTFLRKRQLHNRKFRRQYSVGPYVLDFYCPAERLAVELDGAVHDDPVRADYDGRRQVFIEKQDITVLRFENRQVFEDPDAALNGIAMHFDADT